MDENYSANNNSFPSNPEYYENNNNNNIQYPYIAGQNIDKNNQKNIDLEKDKCKENSILGLLIFLGVLCQPLYLIFYFLYGLMECYRRFSCWFYYVDY